MPTAEEIAAQTKAYRAAQRAAQRAEARNAAAAAIDDRPAKRPKRSSGKKTAPIEICLVDTCDRAATTRGLCNRHYARLGRALKAGLPFDLRTGETVTSPHKPNPPALTSGFTPSFAADEIARVKHAVEVDAATILPFALAFCVAQSLREMGLADNPEAMAAFTSSLAPPALPSSSSHSSSSHPD